LSVVVGLVKDGHVYMAADTRCLEGYEKTTAKKLFAKKHLQWGTWAIGVVGYSRNTEIAAELDLKTLKSEDKRKTTIPQLCRGYFDALREEISDRGVLKDCDAESAFLLAVKGRLFQTDPTFCMTEITTLIAIGTGAPYAEATLWALQTYCPDMPPEQMVRTAVDAAIHFNVSVGGEIEVVVI